MPWLLLLKSPWTYVAIAFAALASYAAVQHLGWQESKAEFAQFRADTEHLAAEAKVKNAQIALQQAHAAQEALDDLQTRNATLNDAYASLRARSGRGGVPKAGTVPTVLSTVQGSSFESDADARCLAVIETADRELAKFSELWRLQEKNTGRLSP